MVFKNQIRSDLPWLSQGCLTYNVVLLCYMIINHLKIDLSFNYDCDDHLMYILINLIYYKGTKMRLLGTT